MRALEPRTSSDGVVEQPPFDKSASRCSHSKLTVGGGLGGFCADCGHDVMVDEVETYLAEHPAAALQSQPSSNEARLPKEGSYFQAMKAASDEIARLREALAEARHTLVRCEHVVDTESEFGNEINERIGHIDAALSNEGNG